MAPKPSAPSRRAARSAIAAGLVACASLLAGASILGGPGPARSATAPAAVPAEQGVVQLPGIAASVLVADLDGDGTGEIIRIAPYAENAGQDAVEVWRLDGGGWALAGKARLRRGTSPDEQRSAVPHPDAAHTLPVLVGDAARLVAWRVAGRERVLAVVNSSEGFNGAPPCCLTVWQVTAGAGDAPLLTKLADTGRGGIAVFSADMDGDGTDEIVVQEPPDPARPDETPVSVLRWDGSRLDRTSVAISAGDPSAVRFSVIGDSDGAPGVEIGLVGQATSSSAARWILNRLSLRGGALVDETMPLAAAGVPLAVPAAGPGGGPELLVGDDQAPVAVVSWPAGSPPQVLRTDPRRGRPLAVLGSTPDQWVVLRRGPWPSGALEVIRPDLALASARPITPSSAAALLLDAPEPPYVGPWPALPGATTQTAFVGAGTLFDASAEADAGARFGISAIASMPGVAPLGWIDAAGTRLAVARTEAAPAVSAEETARSGGALAIGQHLAVAVLPRAVVETPESRSGELVPATVDLPRDPLAAGDQAYLSSRRDLGIGIAAPVGTRAVAVVDTQVTPFVLGLGSPPAGSDATPVMGTSYAVPVQLAASPQVQSRHRVSIYLSTPGGHGYRMILDIRLITAPPSLEADGSLLSFGLSATISGRTDPGTALVVDGARAAVAADGSFRVSVPAGLAPRDVDLVATDPVGHRTRKTVSVVAPLDYRRIPWIPITVALTIIAGGVLFLRVPRPVPGRPVPSVDDGMVEEVEPD